MRAECRRKDNRKPTDVTKMEKREGGIVEIVVEVNGLIMGFDWRGPDGNDGSVGIGNDNDETRVLYRSRKQYQNTVISGTENNIEEGSQSN